VTSVVGRGDKPFDLWKALRLVVITDFKLAAPRPLEHVVREALAAGARAIQLRDKTASTAQLLNTALTLRQVTHEAYALLFVNDRLDVALAAGADGVHLGPDDVPLEAARRVAPPGFLLGYSTDDPDAARRAEAEGADYLGCGAVWRTSSKVVGDEAIGLDRLDQVSRAVRIPVVAIGGVTAERARAVALTRAAGVAVIGAVMEAPDPRAAASELLEPFLNR
jgi:thiamine-phosphate pyrophosphorylase